MDKQTFEQLAYDSIKDMEDYQRLVDKHNEELNTRAQELAQEKADDLFNEKKENYRLETIREINAANVIAKAKEVSSSSPYISENVVVGGRELVGVDFIPDTPNRDSLYSETQLLYNDYSHEWQLLYKNGKRKFVSNFEVSLVGIINASGPGQCQAIAVWTQDAEKPLIFIDGDVSPSALRKQTRFGRKGTSVSNEVYCETFVRSMRKCQKVVFVTIPEHSGVNLLQGGKYYYTSSLSIIPGLEELYAEEIKQHQLIEHDRDFNQVLADYKAVIPDSWKVKLCIAIRLMSILLPFYGAENLRPDRFFAVSPSDEKCQEALIALTSRFRYTSPVVTSATCRITKVREALSTGNDVTAIFTYFGREGNMRAFENALGEIYRNVTDANGFEDLTRKVIVLYTDIPCSIPEEYPVYYLSFTDKIDYPDTQTLQRLSGEFDYSIIQILVNNPDATKGLVHQAVIDAKNLLIHCPDTERIETMTMLIATITLLVKMQIITESEKQSILGWLEKDATSRMSAAEDICSRFKAAVCQSIITGDLRIAKQEGPPYYSDDGCTVFIANTDGSVNFTENVINSLILPKIPAVHNIAQLNKAIIEKELLISTHTNKRVFKVCYETGACDSVDVFSYRRSILNAEAKKYVDDCINSEFWFDEGTTPDDFIPVLYHLDSRKVAGYVLDESVDVNLHEAYFGITRSGKSYALLQTALLRAKRGEKVIIFDQSGNFTERELSKHLGEKIANEYFRSWDVYQEGLPVDLISLQGCLNYKEKKERLTRIYALLARSLGSREERILDKAVRVMLQEKEDTADIMIWDIVAYISNDQDENGKKINDDSHRNLLYKIEAILDDLRETPVTKRNWDELMMQEKPILVISTGVDSIDKKSDLVEAMIESLYHFKQCYTDEAYTVVIDELQDLSLQEKGAVNTLLRKVGKHQVSMLLGSQSFPDRNTALGNVVGNCARIRGYRPKANDVMHSADFFGCDSKEIDALQQGVCFDKGPFYSRYREENVVTTLKGRTILFAPVSDEES